MTPYRLPIVSVPPPPRRCARCHALNSVLLHRLFGLVFCTVGAMTALSGFMFWFDPPDVPLNNVFLAAMVGLGAIGIGHAIWIANIGALIILLTAIMTRVLAISAFYELGRPARDTH